MDDLVRIFGPRVRSVLAEEFSRQLTAVGGGQDVYAAAVSHADGLAWWTAVNTPIFHEKTVGDDPLDDESARHMRWFPDEWGAPVARQSPQSSDLLMDLEAWISDSSHTKSSTWTEVRRSLVDLLVESVDSSDVRSVFSDVGAVPVLFVFEGDVNPSQAVAVLERLNSNHPNPAALADALTYWRDEA